MIFMDSMKLTGYNKLLHKIKSSLQFVLEMKYSFSHKMESIINAYIADIIIQYHNKTTY